MTEDYIDGCRRNETVFTKPCYGGGGDVKQCEATADVLDMEPEVCAIPGHCERIAPGGHERRLDCRLRRVALKVR